MNKRNANRKRFAATLPKKENRIRFHLAMILYTVIIAGSFPVVSAITGELNSTVLTFWRFLAATTVFALMLPLAKGGVERPSIRDLGRYGIVGGSYAFFFILMFEALKFTSPLNTSTIYTTLPFLTLLLERFFGEPIRPRKLAILALSMVAAAWVIFRGDWEKMVALRFSKGDLIFFLGTISLAVYVVSLKKLHKPGESKILFTFFSLLIATAALLAASLIEAGSITFPGARVWTGLAYLAVLSTAVTFWLLQYSAIRLGPNRVVAYTFLTPSAVAVLQWSLGLAKMEPSVLPGIGITLLAVWLLQRN